MKLTEIDMRGGFEVLSGTEHSQATTMVSSLVGSQSHTSYRRCVDSS